MKKKIFSFLIVMLMLISITPYALATSVKLPAIDVGEDFVVVHNMHYGSIGDPATYVVLPYSSIRINGDRFQYWSGSPCYYLKSNVWHKGTMNLGMDASFDSLYYDSSGNLGIQNRVEIERPISFEDMTAYYDGLKGQLNVQNIVQIIVVGAGACVGLVFLYWGCRKGVKALMSAFKKGKLSL